jgi:hypothetical protein
LVCLSVTQGWTLWLNEVRWGVAEQEEFLNYAQPTGVCVWYIV